MNKPFSFKHAFREGSTWVEGPWVVEGPGFSMMLHDRTEAALLTKKLNDYERNRKLDAETRGECGYRHPGGTCMDS